MGNASRIRYPDAEPCYTSKPTHIRVYSEDHGDEWPWCIDLVDDQGNYTDLINRYGSLQEALDNVGTCLRDWISEVGADVVVTRANQESDVIYVGMTERWGPVRPHLTCFVTPDGWGRIYYDGINHAVRERGPLPVRFVSRVED